MTEAQLKRLRKEFTEFVGKWPFHLFVTLQFNDARNLTLDRVSGMLRMRSRLREWDARVARLVTGRYWATNPDRPFSLWVPEKVENSPHWHGLVRLMPEDLARRANQASLIVQKGPSIWQQLVPAGTCVIELVDDQRGAIDYLAKSIPYEITYEHIIYPDEFVRG